MVVKEAHIKGCGVMKCINEVLEGIEGVVCCGVNEESKESRKEGCAPVISP